MTNNLSTMAITEDVVVRTAQGIVFSNLSGEMVLLNLDTGIYYGLNSVGTRVWELIQQPMRLHEIRDVVLDEFEVEPDRCERDLQALLQDLAGHQLIKVDHAPTM